MPTAGSAERTPAAGRPRHESADHPIARPSGTPRTAAVPTASSTRYRLSKIWVNSTPRPRRSTAAENTAVGGGIITSSCGLMRCPNTLINCHATTNVTNSQKCERRPSRRRQAGCGGGTIEAVRLATSSLISAARRLAAAGDDSTSWTARSSPTGDERCDSNALRPASLMACRFYP